MPTNNKSKQAIYSSRHYNKNKEEYYARNKMKILALKAYVESTKWNKPCVDCNCIYPPYVMDYDHLGDKLYSISDMTKRGATTKKIDQEIAKCELVCANCHRARTYDRIKNKHK